MRPAEFSFNKVSGIRVLLRIEPEIYIEAEEKERRGKKNDG